jgi:hypothetical protein
MCVRFIATLKRCRLASLGIFAGFAFLSQVVLGLSWWLFLAFSSSLLLLQIFGTILAASLLAHVGAASTFALPIVEEREFSKPIARR